MHMVYAAPRGAKLQVEAPKKVLSEKDLQNILVKILTGFGTTPKDGKHQTFKKLTAEAEVDRDEIGLQALQLNMAEVEDYKVDSEAGLQAFKTLMAEAQKPDGDDEVFEAQLQEFFAREQVPARAQKWWRRFWRGTKRFFRKAWNVVKKVWRFLG